jgi:hypothetical protein
MTDNPDTPPTEYDPNEIIVVPDTGLRVRREDYEIENELFSSRGHDAILAETGITVPAYLTKSYYNPKYSMGRHNIEYVAKEKATRLCKRNYPRRTARDMKDLYDEARHTFNLWWIYLEDAKDASEADEEAAGEIYIKHFMETYYGEVYRSDYEHPENREAYRERVDQHVTYVEKYQKARVRSYDDYSNYYLTSTRWKQNIAADGRKGGSEAAGEDADIGIGYRGSSDLEKLADERFGALWSDLSLQVYFNDQLLFDFLGLRHIYVQNFMRVYSERARGGEASPQAGQAGARIVTTKLDRDVRVYVVEITDPEHLSTPIQVEVAVSNEDDIELREVTGDAG